MLKIRSVWKAAELKRFKELEKKYHYRPLLAETFCDVEHSAGTCYKAAGLIPLGMTKDFTRTNRQECDFYVPNDRSKTLWVKPLVPDALEISTAVLAREQRQVVRQSSSWKKTAVFLVKERGLFSG